ncbi:DUF6270 domain-containing protein [Roseibium sp.]|uniref:DUF6270 domain-containing protein n=1 Tax=Roseibium sp. TaxID=1936156 RepID=UPI003D0D0A0B
MKEKKVLVLGGCASLGLVQGVTGNGLNVPRLSHARTGGVSFSRTTLNSIFSEKQSEPNLDVLEKDYEKNWIRQDFNKSFLSFVEHKEFDVLLIDFLSERYPLSYPPNSPEKIVTVSDLAKKANVIPKDWCEIAPYEAGRKKDLEKYLLNLVEILKKKEKSPKVIINTVRCDEDFDKENNKSAIILNKHLSSLYDLIRERHDLSEINYEDNVLKACEGHPYGDAPFHFGPSFYECGQKQLKDFMGVV